MDDKQQKRLYELAFAYCEESLTKEEIGELQQILESDKEALAEYFQCVKLHGRLGRLLRGLGDEIDFSGVNVEQLVAVRDDEGPSNNTARRGWKGFGFTLLALAASLLVIVIYQSRDSREPVNYAARVVEKVDCDWETERWGTSLSDELQAGRVLNLNRGLMVLEFAEGALVTLEGPVQFEIESAERGFLYSGRLTAKVPPRARGFTVGTPSCESIDLGTEFGLLVRADGTAETHVFDGEVILKRSSEENEDETEELHLTTNMASRVSGESLELNEFEAKSKLFTLFDYSAQSNAGYDSAVAAAIPESSKLSLWFDASRAVQLDAKDRVSSWGDIQFGDNTEPQNAWQVAAFKRPYFVEGSIGRMPAVRFQGKTHLVTAPVATGDDLSVFIVFKCLPQELEVGKAAMLMNFNGPPNAVVSRKAGNELVGRMYSGRQGEGDFRHGTWLADQVLEDNEPTVVAFTYGYTENRSALFSDAALRQTGEAQASAAITSPKFIGKHRTDNKGFFHGDIAEILVFNTAFTDVDAKKLSLVLMEKYGIDTSTQSTSNSE